MDPLVHYYDKYGYQKEEVRQLISGTKYLLVELKNGNTGLCATLGTPATDIHFEQPDLRKRDHRIVYNAWLNARLNYQQSYPEDIDIFDALDFTRYENLVMIGYFATVLEKFKKAGKKIDVFDFSGKYSDTRPESEKASYLRKADAVIMTATSIFNNTFELMSRETNSDCEVFLLGPSAILDKELLKLKQLKVVFGSVFTPGSTELYELVRNGKGTRAFQPWLQKVYLKQEDYEL